MHISQLRLENWKNFRAASCNLLQRAIFIGPNASGKSNLLDAFRFLRDVAATEGGGLQTAIATRHGLSAVRYIAARQKPEVSIAIELHSDDKPKWRYEVTFGGSGKPKDSRAIIRSERVTHFDANKPEGFSILNRPDANDKKDKERLTETALEQTSANRDFREIAEFLRSIQYLHVVPQIVRDPARALDTGDDPFGGDLLTRINRTPERTRRARLKRMNDALKIAVPQMDDLQMEIDERGVPHLRAKYTHWRPQGAWQREDQFSDGTLRLLGLIWTLQETGGPILIEEPELSLNATVVSHLPRMIAKATRKQSALRDARQTLISTHSPDLLSDEAIGLDEVFLLNPTSSGTDIIVANTLAEARAMIDEGHSISDAVLPRAKPQNVERLSQLSLI